MKFRLKIRRMFNPSLFVVLGDAETTPEPFPFDSCCDSAFTPQQDACPECGARLRKLGKDVFRD